MTTSGPYAYGVTSGSADRRDVRPADQGAMLAAVREDIRQTLRTSWIDPALEAGAMSPALFTAAWSAIRPNVGKSFLALAKSLRTDALGSVHSSFELPDFPNVLWGRLSEEEVHRAAESARALYLTMPKVQIVVHALHRAVRRERIPGTGREEPPIRRGIPEWQRWMALHPAPEAAAAVLEDASERLGAPSAPATLRLFARWPVALGSLWEAVRPICGTQSWETAAASLRRLVLRGVSSLPHPVELQWGALKARGFAEDERVRLLNILAAYDAAMASQTLLSTFVWAAMGAPETGSDG